MSMMDTVILAVGFALMALSLTGWMWLKRRRRLREAEQRWNETQRRYMWSPRAGYHPDTRAARTRAIQENLNEDMAAAVAAAYPSGGPVGGMVVGSAFEAGGGTFGGAGAQGAWEEPKEEKGTADLAEQAGISDIKVESASSPSPTFDSSPSVDSSPSTSSSSD
jgi:hypothetical protein